MKLGIRIVVIGCSGGKSTLSLKLAEVTGLTLIHLDKEYWRNGWVENRYDEWHARHDVLITNERWIIDGNFGGTLEKRIKRSDTVIFLDMSTLTCLFGVIKRVLRNYGKTRPDMADGCPERFDLDFMRFVCGFRKKQRVEITKLIEKNKDKQIITFITRGEINKWLEGMK